MKANRKCNYCGEEYYCCKSCISINSWKNICCSVNCFKNLMKDDIAVNPQELNKEVGDRMATVLRAGLKDNSTIDIVGYDLELGKFDCSDKKTRILEDFEYFIIPREELKEISDKLKKTADEENKPRRKKNELE